MLTPLDDFVLLGGEPQAGDATAFAVLQLCELGYVGIVHLRPSAVSLRRTGKQVELLDAPWIHDTLSALFGDPNDYEAAQTLGGPDNAFTLPIARNLLGKARKRVRRAGLIHRLRPRNVLLGARTVGFVAWMAAFAFVAFHATSVVGALGVAVTGILVWVLLFMGYLDRLGQQRVFYTRKGKKEAARLGQCYGAEPNVVPYQPIKVLLGDQSSLTRWRWHGNVRSTAEMAGVMAIMAAALNPPPTPRHRGRTKGVPAQVDTPQAEIAKAS